MRRVYLPSLLTFAAAALSLLVAVPAQAASSGGAGPYHGSSGTPASTNLASLPAGGRVSSHPHPYLHPGGQQVLDAQRAAGAPLAPSTGIQDPATSSTSLTPTAGTGFDGITSAESSCGCYPPDGAVAAGPTYVVAAANTALKVFTKTGGVAKAAVSLGTFFSGAGCYSNFSDPGAQYDAANGGHYVLEVLTYDRFYDSSICMAVSQTSDATGSWWLFNFPVSGSGNLLDFPQFAIGSDAVYLSGNQFTNGQTFNGARVYAYNKAQLETGAVTSDVFFNVGNDAANGASDTLYPAKGVTVSGAMYFINADNNASTGNTISLWKWTSPFGADTFNLQGGVTVTTYSQPVKAAESGGGTTDAGDTRDLGAAYYSGTVYGAHPIGCNPGGGGTEVDCVQWYQLSNVDGAPSLVQQGILGAAGQYRYYPNLSTDSAGDLLMGYAYTSSTVFPGVRYSGRVPADASGTLEAESTFVNGGAAINGTRYGDYAGEQVDTDGCTVWHLEEYAPSNTSLLWDTWIDTMKFSGCGGTVSPDFTVSASPSSQTVATSGSTSYTTTVGSVGGFSSSVSLSASPAITGVTYGFSPASVTPPANGSGTSTLTVTTSSAAAGTYTVTITGSSGGVQHSASVQLVIQSPDFTISASPSSITIKRTQTAKYTVTANAVGGFTGSVTWTLLNPPTGISGTFSLNPTAPGTSTTLSVNASSSAANGTYTLTIQGTSGTLVHTTTVTLSVTGGRH